MEKDNRPQNIYDDPQFFAGYSQMERFKSGWGRAMEHSHFIELLGEVSRRRVLDLGCGAGQLAFYLAEAGADGYKHSPRSQRSLPFASVYLRQRPG